MSQYAHAFTYHIDTRELEDIDDGSIIPDADVMFDALILLGLRGDVPNITAWDGWSETSDEWIPFEHEQYIFSDGTDEPLDRVFIHGKEIAQIEYSRGTYEMYIEDGSKRWVWDGRTNGIWTELHLVNGHWVF